MLHGLLLTGHVGGLADHVHGGCFDIVQEQILTPCTGLQDVDSREDPALGQAPVQDYLHVAGALEFLEDYIVHAASGVDESSG